MRAVLKAGQSVSQFKLAVHVNPESPPAHTALLVEDAINAGMAGARVSEASPIPVRIESPWLASRLGLYPGRSSSLYMHTIACHMGVVLILHFYSG